MASQVRARPSKRFVGPRGPVLLAAIAASLLAGHAVAGTATATFNVTANINSTCTIQASDLNFGAYAAVTLDGESTITVTCTSTTAWEVGLNAGSSFGATVNNRRMTGPGPSNLNYNLFTDAARTITWGDHPILPGQNTVTGTGTGSAQALTVFGRIPADQRTARPGAFLDTITVTITF